MSKASKKVAILGVTKETLMLARACALQDNPVLGIHDQDPQRALKAALFLGVSAFPTTDDLKVRCPEIVISAGKVTDFDSDCFHLIVGDCPPPATSKACSVNFDLSESEKIPDEILSEIPIVQAKLEGSDEAKLWAREFLAGLSNNIQLKT